MMGNGEGIPLSVLQQWMQTVIEHPGDTDAAWGSEEAQRLLPADEAVRAIRPSGSLSAQERIGIYRRMFVLRMTDSMAIDYPGVRAAMGEEAFDTLILNGYLQAFPSSSYTLDHLGRHFPEYLRTSALTDGAFLADLATLELAIVRVLEAEELAPLTQNDIASVPPDAWDHVRFVPIAALEMHRFDHPVGPFLEAVNEERDLPGREPRPAYTVVFRQQYRAYWTDLSEPQFVLLDMLRSGTPFGTALNTLAAQFPAQEQELQHDLTRWFSEWVTNGLFSRIIINEASEGTP